MLFDEPIDFQDAIDSNKAKALLPTTLSSKELHEIAPELRSRALFSARNAHASVLQKLDDVLGEIIQPKQVARADRETPANPEGKTTTGMNYTQARLKLKDELNRIGYVPKAGEEGTIKDFGSDQRLNLMLETNANMANGFGQHAQMQDEDVLDMYPAQELYRAAARKEPRGSTDKTIGWEERWTELGGQLFDGRMIALANDPIWEQLGTEFDDGLGNPYPPFAFNSGMDVKPVSRTEAQDLGLLTEDEKVLPKKTDFDELLQATPDVKSALLKDALLDSLGSGFHFNGDVLSKVKGVN